MKKLYSTGDLPATDRTQANPPSRSRALPAKGFLAILGLFTLLALAAGSTANADVPGIITYQGRVTSHDTNFSGMGQFRFALVRPGLPSTTLWSQDGKETPVNTLSIPVNQGLFTVGLGDTNIPGMLNTIPSAIFDTAEVSLRIWFNDGVNGFAQLTPDQRLTSTAYALRAANVPDGAITGAKIATGAVGNSDLADGIVTTPKLSNAAVTSAKLADGSVTPEKIPAESITGQKIAPNSVGSDDISDTLRVRELQVESDGGLDRLQLTEVANSGVLYMNHGSIGRFLAASGTTDGGFLRLYDALGGLGQAQTTVELGSSSVGGYGRFFQDNASAGVQINGQNGSQAGAAILVYREAGLGMTLLGSTGTGQGSLLTLYNGLGAQSLVLDGHSTASGGELSLRDQNGAERVQFLASTSTGQGSSLTMRNGLGSTTVNLDADASGRGSAFSMLNGENITTVVLDANSSGSGLIEVKNSQGATRAELDGQGTSGGGEVILRDEDGTATVQIEAAEGPGNGAQIALYKGAGGNATIVLDADFQGEGRITTQVLEITGGSDLSENFDIRSVEAKPGMIVRIDPAHPGELALSDRAYDRTVAGVVSGAGGVKPGMLMGQRNSKADGKYPVALTGRVYCYVDATEGAIVPGDLITTSATPGHGMKVDDHARAQGAIIGKAMTALESGKGLVLVLVSLQ